MRIVLVAFALLTLASGVTAQAQPNPACRAVASVDDATVEFQRDLFYADDPNEDSVYTRLRARFGIQKLGPSASAVPIRDVTVCEAWLPAITAALKAKYGPDHTTDGYLFQMIQYGPYMMVVGDTDPATVPPGVNLGGSLIPLLIFEVSGKRYLGVMLG
jgi:hypothetical protein